MYLYTPFDPVQPFLAPRNHILHAISLQNAQRQAPESIPLVRRLDSPPCVSRKYKEIPRPSSFWFRRNGHHMAFPGKQKSPPRGNHGVADGITQDFHLAKLSHAGVGREDEQFILPVVAAPKLSTPRMFSARNQGYLTPSKMVEVVNFPRPDLYSVCVGRYLSLTNKRGSMLRALMGLRTIMGSRCLPSWAQCGHSLRKWLMRDGRKGTIRRWIQVQKNPRHLWVVVYPC